MPTYQCLFLDEKARVLRMEIFGASDDIDARREAMILMTRIASLDMNCGRISGWSMSTCRSNYDDEQVRQERHLALPWPLRGWCPQQDSNPCYRRERAKLFGRAWGPLAVNLLKKRYLST